MKKVKILPLNKKWKVQQGTNLGKLLRDKIGFELPCGGRGKCGNCKVKILSGDIDITEKMQKIFTEEELNQGVRLACESNIYDDIAIELVENEINTAQVEEHKRPAEMTSTEYGIAIDAGSTTIAGRIVDLTAGTVLYTITLGNAQRKYGSDIMSRLEYIQKHGIESLQQSLRRSIYEMIKRLQNKIEESPIKKINIVGNTFVHHTFCGFDTEKLITPPYEPHSKQAVIYNTSELDWDIKGKPNINILPVLGGFVGSDILAGIFARKMDSTKENCILIDLGTNGEIVAGNENKLIFASTAAGPAFEAGNIKMGMRAKKGAITAVHCEDNQIRTTIMEKDKPKGICGSGLLDAIACGLELGKIDNSGKILSDSGEFMLENPVKLVQNDVREVQLAKGALSAGIKILLEKELEIDKREIDKIYLAGAFGNYIKVKSAIRTGLLDFKSEQIINAGNTALQGAVKSLFNKDYKKIPQKVEHIDLGTHQDFQDLFIKEMQF